MRILQVRVTYLVFCLLVCSTLFGVFLFSGCDLPSLEKTEPSPRQAAREMMCSNNMKQIGLAMHNYHDMFKTFPPAYVTGPDGKPMHSWRALILPFLVVNTQYDYTKPWDSPANQSVVSQVIDEYRCPADDAAMENRTNYVMVLAPGHFSDGESATAIKDIEDGTADTIMLVEVRNSDIPWAEPRDLTLDDIKEINTEKDQPGSFGSYHFGDIILVTTADSAVHRIGQNVSIEDFKKMLTIAGGEDCPIPGYNDSEE